MYACMQYDNALAMRTALETGMRIGDVCALRRENLHGRKITYRAQKTGKEATKTVSIDLMRQLLKNEQNGWIFPGRWGDKPRSRQTVWKDVKQAARRLGIDANVGTHSARKTYAVELLHDKGLPAVQAALQHDRAETTMLYAFADAMINEKKPPNWAAFRDLLRSERMFWLDLLVKEGIIRTESLQIQECEMKKESGGE